jgi:hypothetical protein
VKVVTWNLLATASYYCSKSQEVIGWELASGANKIEALRILDPSVLNKKKLNKYDLM